MNGTRQHSAGRERGAALIVAIGVLTLLLVIALTFFRASVGDVRTAQNTVDGVRAELLADGGTALAMAFLNHDRAIHPSYTALEFAYRSYFNGTFAAGKPHLWAPVMDPNTAYGVHRLSPLRGGIVEIDPRRLTDGGGDALYIPRVDIGFFPSFNDFSQAYSVRDYVTINADDDLQNPFILTADLADPADRRNRSPLESVLNDTRLNGRIVFSPEDFDALETVVYDDVAPDGRLISLRENMINAPGLAVATNETLPYEQVHFLADVDNDGDGLNDSVWIPVGADRYYPEDGLDNDLDGYIDGADLDGEPGVFMYRGDTDNIDNDFDGIVDEDDEFNYVTFTVPVPWRADVDGNGTLDRVLPTALEIQRMGITNSDIVRFEGDVNPTTGEPIEIGQGRVGNFIYSRDNDYDLVLDQPVDASHYMLGGPYDVNGNGRPDVLDALANYAQSGVDDYGTTDPTIPVTPYLNLLVSIIGQDDLEAWQQAGAYGTPIPTWGRDGIDNDGDGQIDEGDEYAYLIQGETMTELTGRIAVLITDESSKVNINAAGGWAYPNFPDLNNTPSGPLLGLNLVTEPSTADTPLQRSFADGLGPHEFDTRVIPGVGENRARWMWQFIMGARQGFYAQDFTEEISGNIYRLSDDNVPFDQLFEGDATLPGYGYVDDNANLLQLALSHTNNRGGPNYRTVPNDPSDVIDPRIDLGLELGKWDGIDEPKEYQTFRPYRNIVAEENGFEDDGDDARDEVGELGDQYYRTTQQLKLINVGDENGFRRGFDDDGIFNDIRNYITVHSTDRNERHFHQDSALASFDQSKYRQTTGQRKDLNLTRSGDVARAAKRDWTFPVGVAEAWSLQGGIPSLRDAVLDFAENPSSYLLDKTTMPDEGYTIDFLLGMRQENTSVISDEMIMGFDPGTDAQGRTRVFTMLADPELRAHQVAATLKDYADLDYTRSLDDQIFVPDYWWRRMADRALASDATLADAERIARSQRIYHTVAGLEAIRINELNVRPVRRFEAEAVTDLNQADLTAAGLNIAQVRGLDPNRFVARGPTYPPADRVEAEAVEEQGFRVRTRTTTQAIDDYNARASDNIIEVLTGDDADPTGQRWNLRPFVDFNGTAATDAGLLGLEAAWSTYRRYITVTDPDDNNGDGANYEVPDVVQFSFQATEGLPAGRYYVTVNTTYVDPDDGIILPSVGQQSDFLFAVKTGTLEQDWFADVMNIESYVNAGQIYNQVWRAPALLGSDDLGGSAGMAFLQGDAVFDFDPAVPAGLFTTTIDEFDQNNHLDERNLGFTIEVPEIDPDNDPATERWVHIAFRRGFGPVDDNNEDVLGQNRRGFVINYLEFSQEPDHEWVEITNQSDEAVDLSGWELKVETHPLGIGPMRIPAGTTIAPRGMLLLGTNKFDYGYNFVGDTDNPIIQNPNPVRPIDTDRDVRPPQPTDNPANPPYDRGIGFFANGIGLVAQDNSNPTNIFFGVTVPQTVVDYGDLTQGSVFYRPDTLFIDFMDQDGNGLREIPPPALPDDTVISTVDPAVLGLPVDGTKPWDRIVELIIPDLVPQQGGTNFSASDVGRIVLGGGIFPNTPEQDFTDNDGDNRILAFDGIDNDGDEAERVRDGIDNDDDGTVDEPGEGIDEIYEPVGLENPIRVRVYEGVDEGRFMRNERLRIGAPVPGGYNQEIPRYRTMFFDIDTDTNNTNRIEPAFWTGDADPNDLLQQDNPPQWKEFMERRNFPGDNVLVTLYEGPAIEGRIADRVTYTQRDVENRQIDDVVLVTDFDMNSTGELDPLTDSGVQLPLDDRFESFWPENTMGQDFARSLERKHPDYTGDRFGTQNRFQATDGNYDDWSDSTGRWARRMSIDDTGVLQDTAMIDRRFVTEYRHALGGTPLRRNVSARMAEDFDLTTPTGTLPERATTFATVDFRNHPLVSPGDALTMPHTMRRMVTGVPLANGVTGETYLLDRASTNVEYALAITGVGDLTWDSVMMGQHFDDSPLRTAINFFHEQRAFIGDVGTTDAVALNVGQASVIQVARPADTDPPNDFLGRRNWTVGIGSPPQVWAPLMVFELDDDSGFVGPYSYERQYLFQRLASLPGTVDNTRWPMPLRTALYASRNFANVDASDPADGAQAVFVWDGEDGLENGEYDLYVVTTEDLSLLSRADDDLFDSSGQRLLTDAASAPNTGIGAPFVAAAENTGNNEVYLDIEVFRDSNGDRKAWTPDLFPGGFLRDNQFQRGGAGVPAESFGVLRNVQPDADGVIRYGNVRVENNFLAVSIRNRSASGTVARVSRVMLAARGKTPGRININTVETKRINTIDDADEQYRNFYNPLMGLPGVLERFADDEDVGADEMFVNLGDDPLNLIVEPTITAETDNDLSAAFFARRVVQQRLRLLREQPDGRYYELVSDLLLDAHFARVADNPATATANDAALHPPLVVEYDNYLDDLDEDGVVDTNEFRSGMLREEAFRFGKMQNLITVKGEVFEILVTAQSGYGTDVDGDGRINWRDDREFTPMAEKTARTIYER